MDNFDNPENPRERRKAFRVEDQAIIFIKEINSKQLSEIPTGIFEYEHESTFLKSMEYLNKQYSAAIALLQKQNVTLASCLNILDAKIHLLTQEMSCPAYVKEQPPQLISISEEGAAFGCKDELETNSCLCVRIILQPSMLTISCTATVVSCKDTQILENPKQTAFPFWLAVKFQAVDPLERQWLSRHILQTQAKDRRSDLEANI